MTEYDPITKQPINPLPPPPPNPVAGSITINDVSTTEGNSGSHLATFTITRTGGTLAFDVNAATGDGSATLANNDYLSHLDTLHFAAGVNTQTFSVQINGDTAIEPNETFSVNLSGATNGASVADGIGIGTIMNDDNPPPPPNGYDGPPYINGPYSLHMVDATHFVMPTQWVVSDPNDPSYLPPRYHGLNAEDLYIPDGFDGNHDGLGSLNPAYVKGGLSDFTYIFFSENYWFV